MSSYDNWKLAGPPERDVVEGDGDPECDECFGQGWVIEQDPDTGRGERVECSCVERLAQAAERDVDEADASARDDDE